MLKERYERLWALFLRRHNFVRSIGYGVHDGSVEE